jgi:hypothetical protein
MDSNHDKVIQSFFRPQTVGAISLEPQWIRKHDTRDRAPRLTGLTMADTPVFNSHSDDKTVAEALLGCIKRTHEAYEKALPENRRAVLLVSSSGVTIRVDRFQWINPATVICIQDAHDEGEALQVIVQHVSQLNVVLTSEEIIKSEEPRRTIGFGPAS